MLRSRPRIASTSTSSANYLALIIFVLILAFSLAGCAGSSSSANNTPAPPAPGPGGNTPPPAPPPPPPPASNPALVYVANAMNDTLSAFQINSSGSLQPVPGSPMSAAPAKAIFSLSGTTDGKFLFASEDAGISGGEESGVMAWSVNPGNGKVTPVSGTPFLETGGAGPRELQVTPNGKFVYVVNINTDSVVGYAINPANGALTAVPGSPFSVGTAPAPTGCVSCPLNISIHSSGKFLYVANTTSDSISGFAIDPMTGSLTPIAGSPFSVGPAVGCSPKSVDCSAEVAISGNFLYYTNANADFASGRTSAGSSAIFGFNIDPATGTLLPMAGSPFMNNAIDPDQLAADRSGKFLYSANSGSNSVSAFAINPVSGALNVVAGSPFAAGKGTQGLSVDVSGKFVYATNTGDNTVSGYAINTANGALTPVSGSPFKTGPSPVGITSLP